MNWIIEVLAGLDRTANAVLGGQSEETLSSRAHRMRCKKHRYWGWTASAIDALFFLQLNHCQQSYESERQRKLPHV